MAEAQVAHPRLSELSNVRKDNEPVDTIARVGCPFHVQSGSLIAFLTDKHMLIDLDSCEHVIEAAAVLSEQIL